MPFEIDAYLKSHCERSKLVLNAAIAYIHSYPRDHADKSGFNTEDICERPYVLWQATEDFMVHLLEDCNLCAIHAKRVTISAPLHPPHHVLHP